MEYIIKEGNEKYRNGDYRGALESYLRFLREGGSCSKKFGIELNIKICVSRICLASKGIRERIIVYSCLVGDYECLKESVLMEAFNSIGMRAGVETMWSYKLKQDQACRSVLTTMGVGKVIDKKLKSQNDHCNS